MRSSSPGSIFWPHSVSQWTVSPPYASESSAQRSPNLPHDATSAGRPRRTRLADADSSAPLPDAAKISTSFWVANTYFSRLRTRAYTSTKAGARW